MATLLQRAQYRTAISYVLMFEYVDAPGCGFSFDCDKDGKVANLPAASQANYEKCVNNTHSRKVVSHGVQEFSKRYREAALLQCDCGAKLYLDDAMTNECGCGRFYNGSGQSLAHPSQWGEETGERFDAHGGQIL